MNPLRSPRRPRAVSVRLAAALLAPLAALSAALLAFAPAPAGENGAGGIAVAHPVARPNLPNRPMAVYMTIVNSGETGDRLVAASSPEFGTVELHRTRESEGVMRMEEIGGIDIPPGGEVAFRPGGLHLMLFGAKRLYGRGESFPVTLEFARAGGIDIAVEIGKPGSAEHGRGDHDGHGTGHGR